MFFFRKCSTSITPSNRLWQVACLLIFWSFELQAETWSTTSPPLNLTHIFEGEINKRGKPVGFHVYRDDFENSRIKRIISDPDGRGVYTAEVEIYDREKQRWKRKSFSSFFPNNWSDEKIIAAILNAHSNDDIARPEKFGGPSGHGLRIEGWLCRAHEQPRCPKGGIKTAYPLYFKADQ